MEDNIEYLKNQNKFLKEIWADLTSNLKHIGIKNYERKPILKFKENKDE